MSARLVFVCDEQRHLVCIPYSIANLHAMANELKLNRAWFHSGASYAHYDIPRRRFQEIATRCTVVRPREILKIVRGEK